MASSFRAHNSDRKAEAGIPSRGASATLLARAKRRTFESGRGVSTTAEAADPPAAPNRLALRYEAKRDGGTAGT